MTVEQPSVTLLNQVATIYIVDFSLCPNTCLLTSRQNKNAKLLVGACKLTSTGTVINLGRLTGNKRYSSLKLLPTTPHQGSLFVLGSCPEMSFV
jgi:hypothetical protein